MPLLDQLLFPQRLLLRALEDVHRIAGVVSSFATTFESLRDEVAGVRRAVEPLSDQMEALRALELRRQSGVSIASSRVGSCSSCSVVWSIL